MSDWANPYGYWGGFGTAADAGNRFWNQPGGWFNSPGYENIQKNVPGWGGTGWGQGQQMQSILGGFFAGAGFGGGGGGSGWQSATDQYLGSEPYQNLLGVTQGQMGALESSGAYGGLMAEGQLALGDYEAWGADALGAIRGAFNPLIDKAQAYFGMTRPGGYTPRSAQSFAAGGMDQAAMAGETAQRNLMQSGGRTGLRDIAQTVGMMTQQQGTSQALGQANQMAGQEQYQAAQLDTAARGTAMQNWLSAASGLARGEAQIFQKAKDVGMQALATAGDMWQTSKGLEAGGYAQMVSDYMSAMGMDQAGMPQMSFDYGQGGAQNVSFSGNPFQMASMWGDPGQWGGYNPQGNAYFPSQQPVWSGGGWDYSGGNWY